LAVPIDEFGRFSRLLTEKSELVEIEMGNSAGRSVTTTLALPNLMLIEPAGGEARVVVPNKGTEAEPRLQLSIPYQFVGKAMAGGTLTLNGKEVPVAKDGSFSFTLELAEGEATYWLQVRSPQGYGKHVRLTVSVAPEDGSTKPPGRGSGKVLLGDVTSKPSPKKGIAPRGAKVLSKDATPAVTSVMPVVRPVVAPVASVAPVVPVTSLVPVVAMHIAKRAEAAPTVKAIMAVAAPEKMKLTRDVAGKNEAPPVAGEKTNVKAAPPETAAKGGDTAETGRYSLKIGEYVLAAAMAEAKKKIQLAGLQPEVKPGSNMKEPMIRLLVSEFPDQNAAKKMLARLHNAKADGFALTSSRGCCVYAGSYSGQEGAERERTRLAALGIKVSLKKLQVSVPVQMLFAGSYATREDALQGAAKLEQLGLKSAVMESGS
jgi:cell division protein FtsN